MRFSDFLLVSDPTDLNFIVGYTDEQNIRINVLDLFAGQIIGGGTPGYMPVFTAGNVIGDSVIFQDGSNIVIGGEDSLGYTLAVLGSFYVSNGVVINTTTSGDEGLRVVAEDGDIFVVPNELGQPISSLRRIIHPPAILTTESATLGQLNEAVSTVEGDIELLLDLKVDKISVGAADGVASLDSGGKVPLSQIPDSIIGQVEYMGTWDALTNNPALNPLIPEEKGHYYVVSVAGVFSGVDYQVGDWIISNGIEWQKVDNTDAVTSVFGRIGSILALEGDYQAFYPRLSQAYDNPTWINSISFTKITDVPPFLLENQTITLSGEITGSGKTSISTTISDNAVANSKLRDSIGTSVIGRASSTTGDPADIQATTDGHVLLRSGGNLLFGLISSDSIGSIDWSKIINTPTTLGGYGITDAYTKTESDNKFVPYTGASTNVNLGSNNITANSFIKGGGTSAQFLKADGSVDVSQYVPTTRSVNAGTGLTGGGNLSSDVTIAFDTAWGDNRYAYRTRQLTINGTTYDLSSDRVWDVGTVTSVGLSSSTIGVTIGSTPITSSGTITLAIATASGSQQGLLSSTDWTTFNNKENAITAGTTAQYFRGDKTFQTLNTAAVPESGNLYYTDARSRAALSFVAGSGAYNSSTGVITIPTNNNQITNGAGYITSAALGAYLPLAGGTMTGDITFNAVSGRGIFWGLNTDGAFVRFISTGDSAGQSYLEIGTTDNGDEPIIFTQTGLTRVQIATDGLLKNGSNQNYLFENGGTWGINITGNAGTANTWTTARTITIGNTGKSVDGSGNVAWSLAEIGAYAATNPSGFIALTALSGVAPIQYNNSTGAISITQANASQSGFLSSTDWNTFNNKQNALTNPVTGTGTTNYLPKFTGTSTIGNSNLINDANGNLGLGVTPSAWVGATGLQVQYATVEGRSSIPSFAEYTANSYSESGVRKYITSDFASRYTQFQSNHFWFTSPSGTAGNAITFTQAMTLTSGGNLLVGTTTDNGARLQVSGDGYFSSSSGFNRVRSTNTGTTGFSAAAFEMHVHNGSTVFYGGGMFQTNSTFVYGQIAANQTNIYGYQSGGMRLATGNAPIIFATGNSDLDFSTARLTIASTGAATFSSSVTAEGSRMRALDFFSVGSLNDNDGSFLIDHPGINTWKIGITNANTSTFSIGNDNGGAFAAKYFNITNGGNVLIGTTTDNGARLQVSGTATFSSSVTASSFFESSDATLKTLVEDNYQAKGIESVVAKLYIKNGKKELGYYAQDLQEVLPSAVSKGSDGLLNLSYREVLVAKVQFLEQRVKELEAKLN